MEEGKGAFSVNANLLVVRCPLLGQRTLLCYQSLRFEIRRIVTQEITIDSKMSMTIKESNDELIKSSRFEIFATFKYVSSDRCLKTTSARTTSQATTADWGCSGKVILATVLQ